MIDGFWGAGYGIRTRGLNFGKVTCYHYTKPACSSLTKRIIADLQSNVKPLPEIFRASMKVDVSPGREDGNLWSPSSVGNYAMIAEEQNSNIYTGRAYILIATTCIMHLLRRKVWVFSLVL